METTFQCKHNIINECGSYDMRNWPCIIVHNL
jgi:hypothetical protein